MKIAKYNIPKDNSNNSGNGTPGSVAQLYGTGANSQVTIAESAKQLAETHTIWGQPFNGTQDVAGDIINAQNITNEGDINIKSYNDVSGNHGGNLYADNSVNAKNFIGKTGDFSEKIISTDGIIDELLGKNLEYSYANLAEILSQNITTKNLTVTGTAHFFELIIDKIKAAGGAVILSPADGFKVEKVIRTGSYYRLFWKANDGEKAISNMWKIGDQAICRSFNQATIGTSYNVSNKYYWSVVDAKGTTTINTEDYHYIDIYAINVTSEDGAIPVCDGEVNPEIGDEIAMLGSRATKDDGTPDIERQSAIYISAYSSMDQGLKAPFIAQYTGINDFNLESHRYTWFAHNGNEIRGNFKVSNGETIQDYIDAQIPGSPYRLLPVEEKIYQDNAGDLAIRLMYNVLKDKNQIISCGPTSVNLVLIDKNTNTTYDFTTGTNPSYINQHYIQQYGHNQGEDPEIFHVELRDSKTNAVYARRILNVNMSMLATIELTDKIEARITNSESKLTQAGNKISQLEISLDGITSTVAEMKGLEYDIYNIDNWTWNNLLYNSQEDTDFKDCFYVPEENTESPSPGGGIQTQLNTAMSYKRLIPISNSSTICVNSGWTVDLFYFKENGKYTGTYKTFNPGETKINSVVGAYYVAIRLNKTPSSSSISVGIIQNFKSGLKESGIRISDLKIASSLIQQTADQILMKVDDVALKIDNQKITLDGNTEVNGNLNINNSDTGFTLQGISGNTQISPKSIGTFEQFSLTTNITDTINKAISSRMQNENAQTTNPDQSTGIRNYKTMYKWTESLGTFKMNDFIAFKNHNLNSMQAADGNGMQSGIKKFKIYKSGLSTPVYSYSTESNYTTSLFSYTIEADGEYTMEIEINFNTSRPEPTTPTDPTKPDTDMYRFSMPFTANYSLQVVKPTGDAHMLIGYDGIAANFGNTNTVYIGKNETTIKYGNYGLSITSSGIKKYNGSTWVTANI